MPSTIVDTMTRNCRDDRQTCRSRPAPDFTAERTARESITSVGVARSRALTSRDRVKVARRLDVDMA